LYSILDFFFKVPAPTTPNIDKTPIPTAPPTFQAGGSPAVLRICPDTLAPVNPTPAANPYFPASLREKRGLVNKLSFIASTW